MQREKQWTPWFDFQRQGRVVLRGRKPGVQGAYLLVFAWSYNRPGGPPALLVERNKVTFIEVRVAGMGYDVLALQQVKVVEFAPVAKLHECAPIPVGKFIAELLLGRTLMRPEAKPAAFAVEQGAANGSEFCPASQFTAD